MSEVAVVCGASRGIGLALTAALLGRGALVVAGCRDPAGSRGLAALAERGPAGRLVPVPVDLARPESLGRLAEAARAAGPIQTVLNVAGVLHRPGNMPERSLAQIDPEWMLSSMQVNAVGPVMALQALRPGLARGARVGNVSARVGSIGDNRLGGWWSYRMSKAALNMATKNMAIELRRDKVVAVALHPGTTDTDLSAPFQRNVKPEKLFSVEYTASKLLEVLDSCGLEESGGFFAYDGSRIEW